MKQKILILVMTLLGFSSVNYSMAVEGGRNKITITRPSSYSSYDVGDRIRIRWDSQGDISRVIIGIMSDKLGLNKVIEGNYYNDGEYTYTIPDDFETADDYVIVVMTRNGSAMDRVTNITINNDEEEDKTITITRPSSYSNYDVGDRIRIRWDYTGDISRVHLVIGSKKTGIQKTIASNLWNSGEYTYAIPNDFETADDYIIGIASTDRKAADRVKHITITKEEEKSIKIILPEAYSSFRAGQDMVVTWTSTGGVGDVIIGLGSESTRDVMVTEATNNDGIATIEIPSSWNSADDYVLTVREKNGATRAFVKHITITKPCTKPTGLKAKNITSNSFTAYWNEVDGADRYVLTLYKNGSCVNEYSINGDTEKNITGLDKNTSYYFRVKAECGDDNWSDDGISDNFTTKNQETTACGFPDCTSNNCGTIVNAFEAIKYLCNKGIVSGGGDGKAHPDDNITRGALAKIAYKGLFGDKLTVVSKFPSPYNDLQDKSAYYYEYAKALLYLEYDDGITPFNRDFANFYPENPISRAYVLKVLLETYNIKPDNSGSVPFSDVSRSDDYYGYVKEAYDRGIIVSNTKFHPSRKCTRAEAFIMLYRLLTTADIPSVNGKKDFFLPGNMTPYNIAVEKGLDVGNFNHYTKNCFNIANRGIPMDFSFTYNSFPTELPTDFYPMQPLGYAWTHSYNAYATLLPKSFGTQRTMMIHWPNGTLHLYELDGFRLTPITKGLTDKAYMYMSGKNIFLTITTKSQVKYHFAMSKQQKNLLVLTKIEDRHKNYVKILYENGVQEKGKDKERIAYIEDQFGRKLNFSYHSGTNHLRKVTDPLGRSISFEFDEGKLSEFTDAESHRTVYNYRNKKGEENLLTTIKLPKGNTITNSYTQRKLTSMQYNNNAPTKIEIKPNYGNTSASDYVTSSTVTTKSASTNKDVVTHYKRDDNNNLRYVKNDITKATIEYTNTKNPTLPTKVSQNGITTTMEYDDNGNATEVTVSGGGKTITKRYTYNNENDLTSYTDGNGHYYSFNYVDGNMTRATTPIASTKLDYNSHGQVTLITSPENIKMRYDYDSYGYLTQTQIEGSQIKTSYTYDKIGRVKTVTNAKGNTVTYNYNNVDAITAVTNPLSEKTRYEFDKNDNLISITNAKGNATTMTYDKEDLLRTVSFAGSTKSFSYYYDGSLETLTKPNGQSFSYQYDAMGRLKTDGSTTYRYEQEKLQSITYNGKSITYGYDGLHRINSISYNDMSNNEVRYEYDNNSNITAITYPGGNKVHYTYDAGNRMKTVTDWNNNTTKYDYRNDGLLEKTTYPNEVVTQYKYDKFGRLKEQRTTRKDGSVIAQYTFELDDLGNHIKESLKQPKEVVPQVEEGTTKYTYDDGNHLKTAGNSSYSFDKNGDIENGNGYTYTFDKYGKLTQIAGKYNATYEYDGLGNRRKHNNTRYLLDIMGMSRVLAETDGNSVQHYYVYGLGLISRIDKSNNTNYYVYDFRGSTVAMTDDSRQATITHSYAYDDFGKIIEEEETDSNPFKYVGKMGLMYEDENHYFVRARYYDCNTARFLSEDPIWNTNLYAYAGNNGVMNVDVSGESPQSVISNYKEIVGSAVDVAENYFEGGGSAATILGGVVTLTDIGFTVADSNLSKTQKIEKSAISASSFGISTKIASKLPAIRTAGSLTSSLGNVAGGFAIAKGVESVINDHYYGLRYGYTSQKYKDNQSMVSKGWGHIVDVTFNTDNNPLKGFGRDMWNAYGYGGAYWQLRKMKK